MKATPRPSRVPAPSTRAPLSGRRATKASATEVAATAAHRDARVSRSEEHTSELQSRLHLVCRLLLEKKKNYALRNGRAPLVPFDALGGEAATDQVLKGLTPVADAITGLYASLRADAAAARAGLIAT